MSEIKYLKKIKEILDSEKINIFETEDDNNPIYDDIVERITRLIEKKEKLNYENEYIKKVIEMTDEVLLTISEENKIIFVNRAFEKLFNVSSDSLIGKDIKEITELKPLEKFFLLNDEVDIKKIEMIVNGVKSIFTVKIRIMQGQLKDKIVMIRDISEEIRFADIIGETKQIMAMEDLVSGIAHEIRNPLTPIRGLLQIIKKNMEGKNESFDKYLDIIFGEIDNINNKIEKLNKFTYNSKDENEKIEIDELINVLLSKMIESKIIDTSRIIIEKNLDAKGVYISGNRIKLMEAFENIIKNSCEAISDEGKISLKTQLFKDKLEVIIEDNGKGIKKEFLRKVMNPFFTTKEYKKAMGIGLSISQKIINEHNGKIIIDSEEGKWTSVKVIFYI